MRGVHAPGDLVGTTFTIGDLTVTPVSDGFISFEPTAFFTSSSADDWAVEAHRRYLDDNGRLTLSIGTFLVRGGDRTVLVDTGLGLDDGGDWRGGRLCEGLRAAGAEPEDIDTVVFSHLHGDHVGGSTVSAAPGVRPAFPAASYRCHVRDWEWSEAAQPELHASTLGAVSERFEPLEDGEAVVPGLTVRSAPGHTPGHLVLVLSGGEERALILGDAIHCPLQLTEVDWTMMGDVDPALAVRTREALLRELDDGLPAAAAHFPGLRFGRVMTGASGRRWTSLS